MYCFLLLILIVLLASLRLLGNVFVSKSVVMTTNEPKSCLAIGFYQLQIASLKFVMLEHITTLSNGKCFLYIFLYHFYVRRVVCHLVSKVVMIATQMEYLRSIPLFMNCNEHPLIRRTGMGLSRVPALL